MQWSYNPEDYERESGEYAPIPEGKHRVRIAEVEEKRFNSGKEGFKMTFDVSGYAGHVWFYLVLDPNEVQKTNNRLGKFFDAFDITDTNIAHYSNWVGKVGGAEIIHEEYDGKTQAKVKWLMFPTEITKLPGWKEPSRKEKTEAKPATAQNDGFTAYESDDDLPF